MSETWGPSDDALSARWDYKRVRVDLPPEAHRHSRPKADHPRRLAGRNPRDALAMTVKLRGGPERWYEIETRGRTWRFPGWVAIDDAMSKINSGF